MWMIAAYQRTYSPSRLAWSEGWRPPGAESAFIIWTGWTHDDSTINIVVVLLLLPLFWGSTWTPNMTLNLDLEQDQPPGQMASRPVQPSGRIRSGHPCDQPINKPAWLSMVIWSLSSVRVRRVIMLGVVRICDIRKSPFTDVVAVTQSTYRHFLLCWISWSPSLSRWHVASDVDDSGL